VKVGHRFGILRELLGARGAGCFSEECVSLALCFFFVVSTSGALYLCFLLFLTFLISLGFF